MVQIEYLPIVLTGIGLIVSILYYTLTLQNSNKTQKQQLETRQLQLFMQIFQRYQDPEFHRNAEHKMLMEWQWDDYEDFHNKYGRNGDPESWAIFDTTLTWLDGIGILVKRGHLDPELVNETLFLLIEKGWEKYSPIIQETRKEFNSPQIWINFEYLYNAIKPLNEEIRKNI